MPTVRRVHRVAAAAPTVAGVLRDRRFAAAALGRVGHRIGSGRRLLEPGDRVRIDIRVAGFVGVAAGPWLPVVTRVDAISVGGFTSSLPGVVRHVVTLNPDDPGPGGEGTRVEDVISWTLPVGRGLVADLLAARAAELDARLAAVAATPVVAAAAIVRDGLLLTAQRTHPPALAGRWELPGGQVEPGETDAEAVVRECREELGATVRVTGRLGTDLPLDAPPLLDVAVLRVHTAELVAGSPEPAALDHAALAWRRAGELAELDWVEADRAVLPELGTLLAPVRERNG